MCTRVHTHIYDIFSVQLSADEHFGCFLVFAIVNSVAINIEVHISFQIRVSSGCMSKTRISGSWATLCLVFWRTFMFSIVVAAVYIPTSNVGRFPFLLTPSRICYLRLFKNGHPDRYEMVKMRYTVDNISPWQCLSWEGWSECRRNVHLRRLKYREGTLSWNSVLPWGCILLKKQSKTDKRANIPKNSIA